MAQEQRWAKDLVRVLDSIGDAAASQAIREQYEMPPPPPPPCRPQCGCPNCVKKRSAKQAAACVAAGGGGSKAARLGVYCVPCVCCALLALGLSVALGYPLPGM